MVKNTKGAREGQGRRLCPVIKVRQLDFRPGKEQEVE
jgi:hypothetical protein